MTVYEHGGELVVVDAGLAFPRDEHLGVDLVLPDLGYLRDRRVNAVVLTHGHEDHVGGAAVPAARGRLRPGDRDAAHARPDQGEARRARARRSATELREAETGRADRGRLRSRSTSSGSRTRFRTASRSSLETPAGRVVHTGDWKLDHTPVDGLKTDVGRLAELGNLGVDLMLGDSTNAERPGMTGSERLVGEAFRTLIPLRRGRILVVSFASNIHRMQQAIDVAVQVGRKVAIVGRSMRKNLNIARGLGYLDVPEHVIVKPQDAMELPPGQVMFLCTGSQGEPMSALTRIAYDDHPAVKIERGDTVIISAKPVPGERAARARLDQPARQGRRRGAAPGDRERARLRPRLLRGAADDARAAPAEGRDAGARRVPDARGARAARARRGRARGRDRDRRERLGRRARAGRGAADRRPGRGGAHVRRRPRRRRRPGRRAARPAAALRGRRADHRDDARGHERRRAGAAGADRARLRRLRRAARRAARRGCRGARRSSPRTTSPRSSCSRSTCTTRSAS